MAKIGALSINCMDRGWGRGRSLKISLPSRCGSEKSISFTMMLSKVFKVAIEHVQVTPLRWPTCILTLSQVTVKRGCLKMQKDE